MTGLAKTINPAVAGKPTNIMSHGTVAGNPKLEGFVEQIGHRRAFIHKDADKTFRLGQRQRLAQ